MWGDILFTDVLLTVVSCLFQGRGVPRQDSWRGTPTPARIFPAVTLVTEIGGPFRSIRFERFIASRPELRHVRTRVRSPGQNGVRERAFQSLKYERLYLEEIHDHLELVPIAETFRVEFNKIRPHEHLSWNFPYEVHTGAANPTIPNFDRPETVPPS